MEFELGLAGSSELKKIPASTDEGLLLGLEDPLEEEMATLSSILAWEVLWTEEPSGLQSMGLQSHTRFSK